MRRRRMGILGNGIRPEVVSRYTFSGVMIYSFGCKKYPFGQALRWRMSRYASGELGPGNITS